MRSLIGHPPANELLIKSHTLADPFLAPTPHSQSTAGPRYGATSSTKAV
jgi:hypothetical protein